jgi:excisionase family DNA binding protein
MPDTAETLPDTIRVRTVAKRLGVAPRTVYGAIRRGEIHAVRVGRRVLVPRAALERLLRLDPVGGLLARLREVRGIVEDECAAREGLRVPVRPARLVRALELIVDMAERLEEHTEEPLPR